MYIHESITIRLTASSSQWSRALENIAYESRATQYSILLIDQFISLDVVIYFTKYCVIASIYTYIYTYRIHNKNNNAQTFYCYYYNSKIIQHSINITTFSLLYTTRKYIRIFTLRTRVHRKLYTRVLPSSQRRIPADLRRS